MVQKATFEMTQEVLETSPISEHTDSAIYARDGLYGNILADATNGKHHNWHNADSGFLPKNAVRMVRQAETLAKGVCKISVEALNNMWDYLGRTGNPLDSLSTRQIIGVVEIIARRFGRGAWAEDEVSDFLESRGKTVLEQQRGDEKADIDIRTAKTVNQVKCSANYGNISDGWDKPQEEGKVGRLFWVKPTGEIYNRKFDGSTGMDKWHRIR